LNLDGKRMVRPQDRGRLEITPGGRVLEHGDPHVLYRGDGKGHFRVTSWTGGAFVDEEGRPLAQVPHEWGLTAAFRDLNGDGLPDLYVCNDFHSPDRVWMNEDQSRFRAPPRLAIRHTATFSMSVDFADVDRDGRDDLLVSDMTSRSHGRRLMQIAGMDPYEITPGVFDDRPQLDRTVLQWNRGDGTFAEVAHYAGLENSEWNWSVLFLDVDLDGYEDLLATTGHMFDTQDLDAQAQIQARGPYPPEKIPGKLLMLPPLKQPKLAFRNRGNLTFEECGSAWGFHQTGVSHGMAVADLDNDGDLDLVVNNLNDAAGIYRNDAPAPRIGVRLKGTGGNTRGIGARVTLHGGPVPQAQEIMCGGRYLSCDDAMRVFAAGEPARPLRIEVTWRGGKRSVVADARPNSLYEIDEAAAQAIRDAPAKARSPAPVFEDVSARLNHIHHEDPLDDFQRQPLLPKRLSQLGPGVCWCDVDGDGWEDLLLAGGKGGQLACYRNDGRGGFQRIDSPPWNQTANRDQTTILGWPQGQVLVGTANYEDGRETGGAVVLYSSDQAQPRELVQAGTSSAGPLATADFDGDGNLDLFVGGRVNPGQYPAAASSRLFRQHEGRLALDEINTARLKDAGLVSGTVWSDLDNDGFPELILACEWGPVRVFRNSKGRLEEATRELGLAGHTGWWNGVTTGDLDGDGQLDIIATNWGRNTRYRAGKDSPYTAYYGDLNDDGVFDFVSACREGLSGTEVPDQDLDTLSKGLPFLRARFATHAGYGSASLAEVLGEALKSAKRVQATTLDSMVYLNRGTRFEAVALPPEAQFAPAFAACVGDFDGDGAEDVFLSQNFHATEPKTPRCDAGRGLWLRGDGKGGLRPVPGQESGVLVYGEQRGAAVCDYDHDGRVDLVVSQNAAPTRLFHNTRAKPGLRVRLAGPKSNPGGVGAVVRLQSAVGMGPAREVHGGSGYWSQDATTLVLASPATPEKVIVRWPGGKLTAVAVPRGAGEVVVAW
jgi:hypothetical protein